VGESLETLTARNVKATDTRRYTMTDEQIIKEWQRGWDEAIQYVLDISSEMRDSMDFHNPTLDELEQRIV
jgi:hypothetical protein